MIKLKDIIRESTLITEATRWNVGIEEPNGKVTTTYGHWDGYPEYAGKMLKKYYSNTIKKIAKDPQEAHFINQDYPNMVQKLMRAVK